MPRGGAAAPRQRSLMCGLPLLILLAIAGSFSKPK
jgi:hypothetical protein